jgi:dihydrofolate synthase/folylpolyglutamate synthase
MLADKDIPGILGTMAAAVDAWYLASLPVPRGAPAVRLAEALANLGTTAPVHIHTTVAAAQTAALAQARVGDRVVIFGSFYTVAAVLGDAL